MDHLRVVSLREEILKVFQETMGQKTEVILWQKVRPERRLMLAEIKFIDREEGTLFLKSTNGSPFLFDESKPLQIKSDYRGLSFKGQIKVMKETLLVLDIPEEVYLEDARERERNKIGLYGEHFLTLGPQVEEGEVGEEDWDLKVVDISLKGASVEVPRLVYEKLEEGQQVAISAISSIVLPKKMEAEIVYFAPYLKSVEGHHENRFRMGLKFAMALNPSIMAILQKDPPTN